MRLLIALLLIQGSVFAATFSEKVVIGKVKWQKVVGVRGYCVLKQKVNLQNNAGVPFIQILEKSRAGWSSPKSLSWTLSEDGTHLSLSRAAMLLDQRKCQSPEFKVTLITP